MTFNSARGAASFARWAIFAVWATSIVLTWRGGFQRGLEPPGMQSLPLVYPWRGVFVTMLIITALTGLVYTAIRPASFGWSLKRAGLAIAVTAAFATLFVLTDVTDLPGYAYAPLSATLLLFGLTLLLALMSFGLSRRSTTLPP